MALFKKTPTATEADDTISLDDADHAWWAGRDELQKKFVPKQRVDPTAAPAEEPDASAFASRYSTDSLFNWAATPEPDDPTHGGRGIPLDPYRVLGLPPGASLSQVVAAHRKLAKRYHPDQFFGAPKAEREDAAQQMATINAAYQELRSRLIAHRHTH
ncbi:MAG: J domain-containing protein [Actinobacteria bacterium]|nr:J domain-containing protein [Actinomycetota bacterium]